MIRDTIPPSRFDVVVIDAGAIDAGSGEALAEYQEQRDAASLELFEATDAIASFSWNLKRVRVLHEALAKAMSREVRLLASA